MSKIVHIILVTVLTVSGLNAQDWPLITDDMISKCEADHKNCQNVPVYPSELINKLVEEAGEKITSLFFQEKSEKQTRRLSGTGDRQELNFCNAHEETITPQMAKTIHNDWVWVVNDKGEQAYVVETCIEQGSQCMAILNPQDGHTTICHQKYIYRDGVVVRNEKLVLDKINLKSCCNCEVTA